MFGFFRKKHNHKCECESNHSHHDENHGKWHHQKHGHNCGCEHHHHDKIHNKWHFGGHHKRRHHGKILLDCHEDQKVIVIDNPDKQTCEMGIYPGNILIVIKNNESDTNIVVGVGTSRFIISKKIAQYIQVK